MEASLPAFRAVESTSGEVSLTRFPSFPQRRTQGSSRNKLQADTAEQIISYNIKTHLSNLQEKMLMGKESLRIWRSRRSSRPGRRAPGPGRGGCSGSRHPRLARGEAAAMGRGRNRVRGKQGKAPLPTMPASPAGGACRPLPKGKRRAGGGAPQLGRRLRMDPREQVPESTQCGVEGRVTNQHVVYVAKATSSVSHGSQKTC